MGNFANIQAGQTLKLKGVWKNHPQLGMVTQINSTEQEVMIQFDDRSVTYDYWELLFLLCDNGDNRGDKFQ